MQASSIQNIKPAIPNQAHLEQAVRDLFPQENVVSNPRKQSQFTNPKTGHFFEIDIWVPQLQLGFEFQDDYHYRTTWYSHLTLDMVRRKDDNKRDTVNLAGMTLIRVPCWWVGTSESLVATLNFQRPDLEISSVADPISLNPARGFFQNVELSEIGALMLASFPVDPNFNNSIESCTWWMGEKYDGVRCCWSPVQQVVYSRSGREIPLLDSITLSLPRAPVDGEFWFGRGMFSLIYSLCKGGISQSSWPVLRMISFDSPQTELHYLPFEQRYYHLLHSIPFYHPLIIVVQRILCEGSAHLNSVIGKIIDSGGEGMIMRRVSSRYERGRNPHLIKLKTSYGDKEGLVVGVDNAAVSLKLPSGEVFKVPTHSVHIPTPAVGEVVTFSYDNLARRNIPVNPEIFRKRPDVRWEEVVMNSQAHHVQELPSETFTAQPRGFWTLANMREYMENFARKQNLDPTLPSTWNRIPFKSIYESKGGRTIMRKFRDPFTALISIFPNIGLHNFGKFRKDIRMAWDSPLKRRQFFEKYAKEKGFDYRSPDAWYAQPRAQILSVKGAVNVIHYHQRKISRALMDLFPDIGLEKARFKSWSLFHPIKRRMFFEDYAKQNGFDPLIPNNWYVQSKLKILSLKGISVIISHHNNSLAQTLLDLFPDINLEVSQLLKFSRWNSKENRRAFFETYAFENGFDPLNPKNWYSQPKEKILRSKGGPTVLRFHKNSIANALVDLFPDVRFDKSKLQSAYFSAVRKQFFESFAEANGFDPTDAEHWYMYTTQSVMSIEGGATVLSYHNNQLSQALLDLFPNIGLTKSKFKAQEEWNSRREFFEKFAQENGFDPLVASYWYSPFLKDKIMALKEHKRVVYQHNNSLPQAIADLFPNIGLDKSILFTMWTLNLRTSRRQFFINYAQAKRFDARIAENWYLQPKEDISVMEGYSVVLGHHNDQLTQALIDLFPDVGFDRSKLNLRSKWNFLENRRKCFEDYASHADFDPYIASEWYKQSRKNIMAFKGIGNVMLFYGNSVTKALMDCFPTIGLQTSRFTWTSRSWNYAQYRKGFFTQYAKQHAFDPNDPNMWYQQSLQQILQVEGGREVLFYHKNSVSHALLNLFPDIGLDEDVLNHRFPKIRKKL